MGTFRYRSTLSGEKYVRQILKMKNQKYTIRNVVPTDAEEIAQIYNYYILNTIITFEEMAVSDDIIGERINEIQLS